MRSDFKLTRFGLVLVDEEVFSDPRRKQYTDGREFTLVEDGALNSFFRRWTGLSVESAVSSKLKLPKAVAPFLGSFSSQSLDTETWGKVYRVAYEASTQDIAFLADYRRQLVEMVLAEKCYDQIERWGGLDVVFDYLDLEKVLLLDSRDETIAAAKAYRKALPKAHRSALKIGAWCGLACVEPTSESLSTLSMNDASCGWSRKEGGGSSHRVYIQGKCFSGQKGTRPWAKLEALRDYLEERANGFAEDAPEEAFPGDGTYSDPLTREFPDGKKVADCVRYDPGPKDTAWMKQKDKNFVSRLIHEGQLDVIELLGGNAFLLKHLTEEEIKAAEAECKASGTELKDGYVRWKHLLAAGSDVVKSDWQNDFRAAIEALESHLNDFEGDLDARWALGSCKLALGKVLVSLSQRRVLFEAAQKEFKAVLAADNFNEKAALGVEACTQLVANPGLGMPSDVVRISGIHFQPPLKKETTPSAGAGGAEAEESGRKLFWHGLLASERPKNLVSDDVLRLGSRVWYTPKQLVEHLAQRASNKMTKIRMKILDLSWVTHLQSLGFVEVVDDIRACAAEMESNKLSGLFMLDNNNYGWSAAYAESNRRARKDYCGQDARRDFLASRMPPLSRVSRDDTRETHYDGTSSDWVKQALPGDAPGTYRVQYVPGPSDLDYVRQQDERYLRVLIEEGEFAELAVVGGRAKVVELLSEEEVAAYDAKYALYCQWQALLDKGAEAMGSDWAGDFRSAIAKLEAHLEEHADDVRGRWALASCQLGFGQSLRIKSQQKVFFEKAQAGFNALLAEDNYSLKAAQGVDAATAALAALEAPASPPAPAPVAAAGAGESHKNPALKLEGGLPVVPYAELVMASPPEKLGEGGFGVVFKARWAHMDVAVKKLKAGGEEGVKEALITEAQHMYHLRHANILQLQGICREEGILCMITPIMVGGSLANRLRQDRLCRMQRRGEPMSLLDRLRIALDTASGLAFLHSRGIIHRDLKTLNVLLDDRGRAKICDFGLAQVKHASSRSDVGGISGTPAWLSPERVEGKTPTEKGDVYALGLLLWALLTSQEPYDQVSNIFVLMKMIQEGRCESLPDDAPEPYAAIIKRCWAMAPEDRPSADQVAHELKGMIDGLAEKPAIAESPRYRDHALPPLRLQAASLALHGLLAARGRADTAPTADEAAVRPESHRDADELPAVQPPPSYR